jgi:lipopolysaccharide export system protein LptA
MLSIPDVPGAYTTHLGGGIVTGTCGDATMTGDSAVHLEHRAQAVMIGNVHYQDTTRALDADRVTYYGLEDRVVAEGRVRLVRFRTGATLEGPRVVFFRTLTRGGRTVATGRPRMTLPTGAPGPQADPFVVDADVAEFIGEERAFARGGVEVGRSDLDATADSARFDAHGVGVMYGDPVVKGEGYELRGDSVVARFANDELEEVHSAGAATATGEDFELGSEEIRARVNGEDIERLWAFGTGRAVVSSGRFQLAGDSIDFAFLDGRVDSITAVGAARSVERPEGAPGSPLEEAELTIDLGSNWVVADTIRARFDRPAQPSADVAGEESPGLQRLTAFGNARSFYAAVRDTARTGDPSRNYVIGSSIEIQFEGGEPADVLARDAIGVYLEPVAGNEQQ